MVVGATRDSSLRTRVAGMDLVALQPYLARAADTTVRAGTLDLELDSTVDAGRLRAPGRIAIAGAEDAIACTDEHTCTVERAFVDKLLATPQQLMTQARMAPVVKDGETAGFRVSGIKKGSLATLLGLENGDVVSEINGQRLGNIDDAIAMYQKLRRASHLSVTVERGGALIHKEISIK